MRWGWLKSLRGRAMRNALTDRAVALVFLQLMALVRIWDPLPVETARLRVFDSLQALWPRATTARPVAIVDIDEPSLAALGQWPWPRARLAEMVDRLTKLGAVVVAFDVVFAEPDRMSPPSIARELPQLDDAARAALAALPDSDAAFAAAIARGRVVLGESALGTAAAGRAAAPKRGFGILGPDPRPFLRDYPALLGNLAQLEQAAAGHGLFTLSPERDGIVRRAPMLLSVDGALVPSLTLEVLRVLAGSQSVLVRTDSTGVLGLALPGFAFATDPIGQVWVHFTPHDRNRFVSAKDVASGAVARERIAGKIVMIGTSALGLLDNKTTPTERSMPGVEVHAQILESILERDALRQPAHALAIEVVVTLGASLAIILLAPLIGPLALLGLGALSAMSLIAITVFSYRRDYLLIDATYPLLSSFSVYSTLLFFNYFRERSGRRSIRRAFSQYMSPALVEQLAQSPERLVLGGERRYMTIMFSDVRGFTSLSESYKHDPQGLTTLMNRFLTPLTNAILAANGTIDKYMGDAIMAFWSAPLHDPEHERNACRAALDMLRRLDALNTERAAEPYEGSFKPLEVGIGVNTGECVVGNMGSDLRFDYSVLGDVVNFASRIEGQSKTFGVKVILGDATARAVRDAFPILEIDLLVVKGKSEAQPIWTLLGGPDKLTDPQFLALSDAHERFLALYRGGAFNEAEQQLGACEALAGPFKLDALYALYRSRIANFRETPPPSGWRGVHVALEK
jgi:adenylate cyclase